MLSNSFTMSHLLPPFKYTQVPDKKHIPLQSIAMFTAIPQQKLQENKR